MPRDQPHPQCQHISTPITHDSEFRRKFYSAAEEDDGYRAWRCLCDRVTTKWKTSFLQRHVTRRANKKREWSAKYELDKVSSSTEGLNSAAGLRIKIDIAQSSIRQDLRSTEERRQVMVGALGEEDDVDVDGCGGDALLRYLKNTPKGRYSRSIRYFVKEFLDDYPLNDIRLYQLRQVIYLDCMAVIFLMPKEVRRMVDKMQQDNMDPNASIVSLKLQVYKRSAEVWVRRLPFDMENCPVDSSTFRQIDLDLERTFPNVFASSANNESEEQRKLHSIEVLRKTLLVLCLSFPSVGYCQSLNFIAALILTVFDFHWQLSSMFLLQLLNSTDHQGVPLDGNSLFPMRRSTWIEDGKDSTSRHFVNSTIGRNGSGTSLLNNNYGLKLFGIRSSQIATQNAINNRWNSTKPGRSLQRLELGDAGISTWVTEPIMTLLTSINLGIDNIMHLWDFAILWGFFCPGNCDQAFVEIGISSMTVLMDEVAYCRDVDDINNLFTQNLDQHIQCCRVIDLVCSSSPLNFELFAKTRRDADVQLLEEDRRRASRGGTLPTQEEEEVVRESGSFCDPHVDRCTSDFRRHTEADYLDEVRLIASLKDLPVQLHGGQQLERRSSTMTRRYTGRVGCRPSLITKPYRVRIRAYEKALVDLDLQRSPK
eukprot:GHVH01002887.1.p1 GENE.GHVH01002887.1~~GHVH01002887.1.p1  ORF type:complete len:651 (+),score=74.87 GHVH01002887.1:302-2254(+)